MQLAAVSRCLAPLVILRTSAARGSLEQARQLTTQKELQEIRARVFGEHVGNGSRSGRKVLARPLKGPSMLNWYLQYPPNLPLHANEIEMGRLDDLDEQAAKGRSAPKKGQGKRARR